MSGDKIENPPAFPNPDLGARDFVDIGAYSGMTLRDYFAGLALPQVMKTMKHLDSDPFYWHRTVAYREDRENATKRAYIIADAMLKARATPPEAV